MVKMDHRVVLSVFLLFSLFTASVSSLADEGFISVEATEGGDPLIRQVVDRDDQKSLSAEDHHFSLFKRKFGKTYGSTEEHEYRFKVFKANLRRAARHQRMDPSASSIVFVCTNMLIMSYGMHGEKKKGGFPPAFPFLTDFVLLFQCDPEEPDSCDSGCNGGLMNSAFEYTLKAGGLMREDDYPYTGTDRGTCKFDKSKIAATVANFSVVSLDEDQIAANVVKNGPLAVAINAAYMQTYIGGVSCPYICSRRLNHGVLLVGYGSAGYAPIRLKEKPYWVIKNSWGENWGENGYYKICRGRNICGVDSMVSTVTAVHTTSQ
ncbi:probable cysteine protease RD19B [Carica papaya]|uniref:probable cysteine protease RD19B n=1 Tax=Carica papaya TaxID=3649 RepID=UPI000B8D1B32|nr:probable cysteine protease RD19B [Carica papaya]